MKNQSPSRWILIGLMALVAVLLIVVIVQLNKLSDRPDNSDVVTTTESFEPTPSVAEPETVEVVVEEPAPEPVIEPQKPTISPDLKWARVQGPVKTISETISQKSSFGAKTTHKNVMRFDVNGKYIPDHPKNKRVVRNKKGQIDRIEETDHTEWGDIEYVYSYTYNKDGFVKSELETIDEYSYIGHSYTLNEKGWIVKEESGGHYECTIEGKATYTYTNIDAYGNWQKCVEKSTNIVCTDKSTTTTTITRQITYWK